MTRAAGAALVFKNEHLNPPWSVSLTRQPFSGVRLWLNRFSRLPAVASSIRAFNWKPACSLASWKTAPIARRLTLNRCHTPPRGFRIRCMSAAPAPTSGASVRLTLREQPNQPSWASGFAAFPFFTDLYDWIVAIAWRVEYSRRTALSWTCCLIPGSRGVSASNSWGVRGNAGTVLDVSSGEQIIRDFARRVCSHSGGSHRGGHLASDQRWKLRPSLASHLMTVLTPRLPPPHSLCSSLRRE